jgi:hypothetical protein
MYHWEANIENRVLLISDSILKWVRDMKYLEVRAVPGVRVEQIIEKISSGELKITPFRALIFHLGTNNLKETPYEIMSKMRDLIRLVKNLTPNTKLAISMIIPRPCDLNTAIEDCRITTNNMFKWLCKRMHVTYLNTFRGVSKGGVLDNSYYALDLKHLNWDGIISMRDFFKGATASLMDSSR